MSTVRLLSPSIDLCEVILDQIIPNPTSKKDFSKNIVVFPGKRPAHVLRKKLSERIGASYFPPQVFSIDQFIEFLLREHDDSMDLNDLEAVSMIYDLYCALPEDAKLTNRNFDALEHFVPLGIAWFQEMEELTMSGVSALTLKSAVSHVTVQAAHVLSVLYDKFYETIQQHEYSTRAMRYVQAVQILPQIEMRQYDTIVFAGFFTFTAIEKELILSLLKYPQVVMLFQYGESIQQQLEQLHVQPSMEGELVEAKIHQYESPDAHGEILALNRVYHSMPKDLPARYDDTGIVLPHAENLFPLYHHFLAEFDQTTYNIAMGYPLTRTPVYGYLLTVLDVVIQSKNEALYVPAYLQFILHPYTKNILLRNRTDLTRIMIHAIETEYVREDKRTFVSLKEIEERLLSSERFRRTVESLDDSFALDEMLEHLRTIHQQIIAPFLNAGTLFSFAGQCIAVLELINARSTAFKHPYFSPFLERIVERLAELQKSSLAQRSFTRPEQYRSFLQHFLSNQDVPFTGTPLQGLQILGFLETRSLKFSRIFFLDTNDDVLPGNLQQDVILPLITRDTLGLSTYRDQERIKGYLFDVLFHSAKEVHFFYINNNEKEPSRYLERLRWHEQQRNGSMQSHDQAVMRYGIALDTHLPGPILKNDRTIAHLRTLSYSSSSLDTYLTCGLQFYYQYVLGLRQKENITGDLEQRDVGDIVHAVLQEYYAPYCGKTLDAGIIDGARLKQIVDAVFRKKYGTMLYGEQFITQRQIKKRLHGYLTEFEADRLTQQRITLLSVEEALTVSINGYTLTGKTDRIEADQELHYIIDYKTGHDEKRVRVKFDGLDPNDPNTWKESIGSVQLALYIMMYSHHAGVQSENIIPYIHLLGKNDDLSECAITLFPENGERKVEFAKIQSVIYAILDQIVDPSYPFLPTSEIAQDCPNCPFKTLCGTQWTAKY